MDQSASWLMFPNLGNSLRQRNGSIPWYCTPKRVKSFPIFPANSRCFLIFPDISQPRNHHETPVIIEDSRYFPIFPAKQPAKGKTEIEMASLDDLPQWQCHRF